MSSNSKPEFLNAWNLAWGLLLLALFSVGYSIRDSQPGAMPIISFLILCVVGAYWMTALQPDGDSDE